MADPDTWEGREVTPAEAHVREIGAAIDEPDEAMAHAVEELAGKLANLCTIGTEEAKRLAGALYYTLNAGVDVWTITERVYLVGLVKRR